MSVPRLLDDIAYGLCMDDGDLPIELDDDVPRLLSMTGLPSHQSRCGLLPSHSRSSDMIAGLEMEVVCHNEPAFEMGFVVGASSGEADGKDRRRAVAIRVRIGCLDGGAAVDGCLCFDRSPTTWFRMHLLLATAMKRREVQLVEQTKAAARSLVEISMDEDAAALHAKPRNTRTVQIVRQNALTSLAWRPQIPGSI
jgi:hypothetical protein